MFELCSKLFFQDSCIRWTTQNRPKSMNTRAVVNRNAEDLVGLSTKMHFVRLTGNNEKAATKKYFGS